MPTKRVRKVPKPKVPPPNEQRLVRTSERGTFQTCLHQWQWSYLEKRRNLQEAPALSFGNLIHQALEKRYPPGIKRGPHPAKTFEKLYEEWTAKNYELGMKDSDDDWQKAGELGIDMLENYVDVYGKDEEWKVLASEMTFQVPVFVDCKICEGVGRKVRAHTTKGKAYSKQPCPYCDGIGNVYLFTYVGTMDGVWENRMDGGIRINDYKTTKGDPTQEARNVGYTGALGLQPGAYWTFGVDFLRMKGILTEKQDRALDGMVFTYMRKGMRDDRDTDDKGQALNLDGSVSKRQPLPYFHREVMYRSEQERERYRSRAIVQVKAMIELEKADPADRVKEPGWLTCRMCPWKDACELHELDSSWEEFLDGSTTTWEPYSAHEIEESERK